MRMTLERKFTKTRQTLLLLLLFVSTTTMASTFNKVEARGTGCPLGSTDIVVSPDGTSASVLFNEMMIELPQFDGNNDNDVDVDGQGRSSRFNRNLVQKICNILVESDLGPDKKVEAIEVNIDFRGSTFMDLGSHAFFHSQLINMTGPGRIKEKRRDFVARKIWREGPAEEDWTITSTRRIKVNGSCSRHGDTTAQFNLRNIIRAGLTDRGAAEAASVFIGLDSADLVGKMEFKIHTKNCRSQGGGSNRPARPSRPPRGNGRPGISSCPPGLIFHAPSRRCLTRREFVLTQRR